MEKSFYNKNLVEQKRLVLEALGNLQCTHMLIYRQGARDAIETQFIRVDLTNMNISPDRYMLEWDVTNEKFINVYKWIKKL